MAPADQTFQPRRDDATGQPGALRGSRIGILVSDGSNMHSVRALCRVAQGAGANVELVAPKRQFRDADGELVEADSVLTDGSSAEFDGVAGVVSLDEGDRLANDETVVEWFCDAAEHRKPIAACRGTRVILAAGGIVPDETVVRPEDAEAFVRKVAARH